MPRKRFSNEQIAFALREAENGATVDEVCRKMGVSEPTFYRWKKQFVGMGVLPSQNFRHAVRLPASAFRDVPEFDAGQRDVPSEARQPEGAKPVARTNQLC
ncbi:transposase [Methylobacterium sp. NPDC080182]|uniref:transposase n=1 Tax=Methylobacterium sp. NPDC080182 TaxID=3390590 RepID=UPI003D077FC0